MKIHWIVLVFLGFSLAVSVPAASQSQDKKHSADIAAIKQAAAELDAAYNRRDAVAFSEIFFEDADFQWHTGALLRIGKRLRSTSQTHSKLCQPITGILLHFNTSVF
jgi:hypothetical protein